MAFWPRFRLDGVDDLADFGGSRAERLEFAPGWSVPLHKLGEVHINVVVWRAFKRRLKVFDMQRIDWLADLRLVP